MGAGRDSKAVINMHVNNTTAGRVSGIRPDINMRVRGCGEKGSTGHSGSEVFGENMIRLLKAVEAANNFNIGTSKGVGEIVRE
jgi:hypothetical protein